MLPLSAPENKTPSGLRLKELTIASCPEKLWTKVPAGQAHFLMLFPPADPEAKEYSVGWTASARTDFLWCVKVAIVFPAARSQSLHAVSDTVTNNKARIAFYRTVLSIEPVMTWGSLSWHWTLATVEVWPLSTWIWVFVRMSHTRATASLPAVTRTSNVGCNLFSHVNNILDICALGYFKMRQYWVIHTP